MKRFIPLSILMVLCGISLLAVPAANGGSSDEPAAETSEIVAYYFHGNFRCKTCRTLEAYSKEAVTQGFVDELESERLVWRVVNTDEDEHQHFIEDFELATKSLVLVEYRDGEVVRYKNLKLVWQLLNNKDGFFKYVRDTTREFLDES